jgi:hypothetical protein
MNGVPSPPASEKAFDFASEVVKQQLTLAVGIFALTLTFLKDVVPDSTDTTLIELAWVGYVGSVFFGLLTLMALAGVLGSGTVSGIYTTSVRLFAGLQAVVFFLSLGLTLAFGICAV